MKYQDLCDRLKKSLYQKSKIIRLKIYLFFKFVSVSFKKPSILVLSEIFRQAETSLNYSSESTETLYYIHRNFVNVQLHAFCLATIFN